MKANFKLCICAIILCAISLEAAAMERKKDDTSKFLFQSGYGYGFCHRIDRNFNTRGVAISQTLLYVPFKHWGFGLNFGLDRTYRYSMWDFRPRWWYADAYNNTAYAGPAVSYIPICNEKSHLYLTAGANFLRQTAVYTADVSPDTYENDYDSEIKHTAALQFSVGYTRFITKHIGLGLKCNSWLVPKYGYNISGLVSLDFRF